MRAVRLSIAGEQNRSAVLGRSLPDLERDLTEKLIEFSDLETARPSMKSVLERVDAGNRIERLLEEIGSIEQRIATAKAANLSDAAVQLRRLLPLINDRHGQALLRSALIVVENAADRQF